MKNNFEKERIFYLFMTIITAIVIFYASSIKSTAGGITGFNLATLYHFAIFFMFTFFLSLTLINKKLDFSTIFLIISISLIYSLSDEFHQIFVSGRFASIKDVMIDFAGSLFSIIPIKFLEKSKRI